MKRAAPSLLRFGVGLAAVALAAPLWRGCTFNHTPSMPRGLYMLRPAAEVARGTIVAFSVPAGIRGLVLERNYLPPHAKLLKRVVAVARDEVCIAGDEYRVNGAIIGRILVRDHQGQPLAPARFCGEVPPGQVFVASDDPLSFDSRYFGPIAVDAVTVARPLWTF